MDLSTQLYAHCGEYTKLIEQVKTPCLLSTQGIAALGNPEPQG